MTDRFVTVPDSLELPEAVKVPSARLSDSTAAGRALLDAADAAAQRTALGLGTAATTPATDYATAAQGALADATKVQQVTLTAPLAYTLPVGTPANTVHRVTFTQDGVGGHTVTHGGQPVTVDLTAGAVTTVELHPAGAGYVVRYPSVADLSSLSSTYGADAVDTPGVALREALESRRIAPTLAPITERIEHLRSVVIQSGTDVWAYRTETAGAIPTFQHSADAGFTWTTLSTMPAITDKAYRLSSGTFLAIELSSSQVAGGSNPRVWRSADAGATWTLVTTGLRVGPLTSQGFCEGTDGSVMICEYGIIHLRRGL